MKGSKSKFPCSSSTKVESSTPANIHQGIRILRALLAAMVTSIHIEVASGDDGQARRTEVWATELGKAIEILQQSVGMD